MSHHSVYDDEASIARMASEGQHRKIIGGLWDEIGQLQFDYLRENGLTPQSCLLDIGCGSLRLGAKAVAYLESGNYWGTDINESLLEAGYREEIVPVGLADKLPRTNLIQDSHFDFVGVPHDLDFVIAQSVFTHLPLNHLRLCLANLANHVEGACTFFLTIFEVPEEAAMKSFVQERGGVETRPHRDPYHYTLADLRHAARDLPWSMDFVGNWNHPRNQKMVVFRKTGDEKMNNPDLSSIRQLSAEESVSLPAGADHYRAYVGPANRYDFLSASQFALLFSLGVRETHRVLDFGCGSLRLGRLLIPFLFKGRYYGIDPNAWLIEEALEHELGKDIVGIKKPSFSHNDDFCTDVFGTDFDFIVAQSILTHTGPDLARIFLESASKTLADSGLLLFSYLRGGPGESLPQPGWYYPGCVKYDEEWMLHEMRQVGLHGRAIPWYHPGASWIIGSRSPTELPSHEQLVLLTGSVLRSPQFMASIKIASHT